MFKRQWIKALVGGIAIWASSNVIAIEIKGDLVQGNWVQVLVEPGSQLVFEQRKLNLDNEGRALIAFSRDAKPEKMLTLISPNGYKTEHRLTIKQRDYIVQRIDGLPAKHVTPDEATLAKIREDGRKAVEARKVELAKPYFLSGFIWPAEGWITGVYGSQRILNGHPRRPHFGVDIAEATGTPIYAPADGEVTLAESMELSGHTLFIDHGYGLRSDFMHLEEILVKLGDQVKQGQQVATMGATGRATGPHLHWGMSWFNVRLDPALMFNLDRTLARGARIINNQVIWED